MGKSQGKEKLSITRRTLLKGSAAFMLTACTSKKAVEEAAVEEKTVDNITENQPLIKNPEAVFDTSLKVVNTHHRIHCHGSCMLKAYVKNGRLVNLTSMGDIPRENSKEKDEDLFMRQRRACPRGLSEKKRLYAPNRIKYPMKQTKERGDVTGFVRISWEEAAKTVASYLKEMQERAKELGYLPVFATGNSPAKYLGTTLDIYGHHSAGNQMDAMYAALGPKVQGNPAIDVLNSKLIIIWSTDTRTTQPHLTFFLTKAKEAGIPIVVVDSRFTDTAATYSTGIGKVPGFIAIRPGTDSAMLAAMAYVLYKKKLYNEKFLKEYTFGFFPNDTVTSNSNIENPVTKQSYKGQTFTVPAGESFVEYLESLEKEHKDYKGVLNWAASLTGTTAENIENLALEYGKAPAASFFCGWTTGGAQRTNNGLYYSWFLIALAAMTGNIARRGGGFGMIAPSDGYKIKIGSNPPLTDAKKYGSIKFSIFSLPEVILTGRDARTAEQLRDDVKLLNNIDLGDDPRLHIEMVIKGEGSGDFFTQKANINRKIEAFKKVKYVVCYEQQMSTTAKYSDIVLPAAMNLEQSFFTYGQMNCELDVANKVSDPLYECKLDREITRLICKELGIELKNYTDEEIMKAQWEKAEFPKGYADINPKRTMPDYNTMVQMGEYQLPTPLDKTYIDTMKYKPGEFPTDTGRINFYSPYMAMRQRAQNPVYGPRYIPLKEGYETIQKKEKSRKGVAYSLQFITPHVIHRAHSTFDTVPLLQNTFDNCVEISDIDAKTRGIKTGDMVYVYNDYGCIKLPALVSSRPMPGVIFINEGRIYNPSSEETYTAYIEDNGKGEYKEVVTPVDLGACVSTLTVDMESGAGDPVTHQFTNKSGGFAASGNLCEISVKKPN